MGTDFPRRDEAPVTAVNLVERIGISLESILRRRDRFHDGLALPQHGTQRARGRDDVVIIGESGEPETVSAGSDDTLHIFIGHVHRLGHLLLEGRLPTQPKRNGPTLEMFAHCERLMPTVPPQAHHR